MPASIVNISLLVTTDEGLSDALIGVIANGLTLTSYTDGTGVPTLSSGRTGEIANALYRVEGGDFAVDVTSVSGDGTYYIYIEDVGGSVTAKALSTVPTWRGDLGGYYLSAISNSKAFFRFIKSGTSYNSRTNLIQTVGYVPSSITTDVTGNLTGNVTGNLIGNVNTDLISEKTVDNGVLIDGVLLKDGKSNIKSNSRLHVNYEATTDSIVFDLLFPYTDGVGILLPMNGSMSYGNGFIIISYFADLGSILGKNRIGIGGIYVNLTTNLLTTIEYEMIEDSSDSIDYIMVSI